MAVNLLPMFAAPQQGAGFGVGADETDDRERRRNAREALAAAMAQRRIEHPLQGVNQMVQAAMAGYEERLLREEAAKNKAELAKLLASYAGGGQGQPSAPSATGGMPPTNTNVPTPPAPTPPAPLPVESQPAIMQPPPSMIAGLEGADMGTGDITAAMAPPVPPPPQVAGPDPAAAAEAQQNVAAMQDPMAAMMAKREMAMAMAGSGPQPAAKPMDGPKPYETPARRAMATLDGMMPPGDVPAPVPAMRPLPPPNMMPGQGPLAQQVQAAGRAMPPPPMPMPAQRPEPPAPMPDMASRSIVAGRTPPQPQPQMPAPMGLGGPPEGLQMAPMDGLTVQAPQPSAPQPRGPVSFDFLRGNPNYVDRTRAGGAPIQNLESVVWHDRAGNYNGSSPYHLEVTPDGKIYNHYRADQKGAHAFQMNPKSIGVAYAGAYGSQPTPEAMEALRGIYRGLKEQNPDLRFESHGEAYARTKGTPDQASRAGRDMREASWRTSVMADDQPKGMMALGQQGTAPQAQAQPQPPVQMAQAGGLSQEQLRRIIELNPQLGAQLALEAYKRNNPGEDALLKRQLMQSEINKNNAAAQAAQSKPGDLREVEGPNGKVLVRVGPDNRVQEVYNPNANQPTTAQNIAGGLNNLAKIPGEYDAFDAGVGGWRGDPNSWLGMVARQWGAFSPANWGNTTNSNEVRNRIQADSDALAATLKPLIRKPGEGAWSDKDQAQLNAIVGDLATSQNVQEYGRRLEAVRQRVMSNFGIQLPPLAPVRSYEEQQKFNQGLPPGYSIRRVQ